MRARDGPGFADVRYLFEVASNILQLSFYTATSFAPLILVAGEKLPIFRIQDSSWITTSAARSVLTCHPVLQSILVFLRPRRLSLVIY